LKFRATDKGVETVRKPRAKHPSPKLHEMCFYFPAAPWRPMLHYPFWLVCIYFSFAWIFHCFLRHERSCR